MNIRYIRSYLISKIGSRIIIIYNGSRNKKERYIGNLYRIYNNVFIIRLDNNAIKCFNLNDILTKTIQLYI